MIGPPRDATALYDGPRQAHTIGAGRIIIATPPSSGGLWLAVLDPLLRATR